MSGTVREARLQTPTARARLKRGRQPHWRAIVPGRVHLGYQRRESDICGRWLLRRYVEGRYSVEALGRADDGNGDGLTFEAAEALAQTRVGAAPSMSRLTVRKAMALYVEYLEARGKRTSDVIGRTGHHRHRGRDLDCRHHPQVAGRHGARPGHAALGRRRPPEKRPPPCPGRRRGLPQASQQRKPRAGHSQGRPQPCL